MIAVEETFHSLKLLRPEARAHPFVFLRRIRIPLAVAPELVCQEVRTLHERRLKYLQKA